MTDDRRGQQAEPIYAGLRMTADEFLSLADDGFRYEVVDGVVMMTPSPSFEHQDVAGEIERQIRNYLIEHPVGYVSHELDVRLDAELLYNPDLVFVKSSRVKRRPSKLTIAPDLVVEVLSKRTQRYDLTTKRDDYERCGVHEYWVIDLVRRKITFLRLHRGKYAAAKAQRGKFVSEAVPGFILDVRRVRQTM